ncbi:MAG: DNA translocase FtsK 4TM domain-containing protein [Rikenella sp.]|nr:DNA translocase FtsK 4TM domain-containing protein [Rikenella sp.]
MASRQSSTATRKNTHPSSSAAGHGANRPASRPATTGQTSKKQTPSPQKRAQRTTPTSDTEQTSDRYIWASLTLLFLAGYLAVSTISYLIYWDVDQNIATWGNLFTDLRQDAMNWGGRIGAILANSIIGRWFGIFGELFPLVVFFLAIKLLRLRSMRLRRAIRSTILVMIVGSIAAGHFWGADPQVFGSGWGGTHGVFIARWLEAMIGDEGTTLLVVVLLFGTLYYANGLLIRQWRAQWKAYSERKRAERRVRAEMARLEAQERRLKMEAAMERRREALAAELQQQEQLQQQQQEQQQQIQQQSLSVPQSAVQPQPQSQQPTAEPMPSRPIESQMPQTQSQMQPQMEPQMPEYVPAPAERARLVQNYDGSWGYLMGYDDWGQPIVYGFDRETYYYNLYYNYNNYASSYTAADPSIPAAAPAPLPYSAPASERDEQEEEIRFTVASRGIPGMTAGEQNTRIAPTGEAEQAAQPASTTVRKETTTATKEETTTQRGAAEPTFTVQRSQEEEETYRPEPKPEPVPIPSVRPSSAPADEEPGFLVEQPEEEQVEDAVVNNSDLYDPTLELSHYRKPPVELLDDHTKRVTVTDEELVENKNRIITTLENFGIRIDTIEATIGPTVTLYEIVPAPGVRISKIKNLEDDIALSLSALGIRIIAPIPGKGTVGIEVPNKNKEVVSMYSVIKSPRFHDSKADLPVALGKTIQNETFVFDLAKMPHLLVAGATGQGKSVGLNAIITSLLYKKHPAELKFILVDPKKVELTLYAKLEKHFLAKMPTEEEAIITDTQKVIYTLNSICIEMDARYDLLKAAKVRNIKEYNEKFINRRLNPEKGHRYLPYFVVIVDEFADLIMTAGREIETPIARIAQLARAVGIHLIIATQRPTTNIITGVIKANFPARIAFRVTSMIDSRTILDQPGANQLVGRGDMLISTGSEITRVQCAFIDTPEVERITDHIEHQQGYPSAYELPEYTPEGDDSSSSAAGGDVLAKRDSLFEEVARYVVANQQGSASTIQRKFSIGFNRAGRLIDQLEAAGIVGHSEGGGKPRQVLVNDPMSLEMILDNL